MILHAISKNGLILTAFALVITATLAYLEFNTRTLRQQSIDAVQTRSLNEVIPKQLHDNLLINDYVMTDDTQHLKLKKPRKIFIGKRNGQISSLAIPVNAPDGYGGSILSIVGITVYGEITGVRIFEHKETPGLGDKVEIKKSPWVLSFEGKSLLNTVEKNWNVKKNNGVFDQFTGATITPKAVVRSVRQALLFFQKNKTALLAQAQTQHQSLNPKHSNQEPQDE